MNKNTYIAINVHNINGPQRSPKNKTILYYSKKKKVLSFNLLYSHSFRSVFFSFKYNTCLNFIPTAFKSLI